MKNFRYKFLISYDGTEFSGWQTQLNGVSIQDVIEGCLSVVLRRTPCKGTLVGSGRTDAGVHAFGQVAHFISFEAFDTTKVLLSLNALLPKTIRILAIELVEDSFHARFSAIGKEYHYRLLLTAARDPLQGRYRTKIAPSLDLSLISQAIPYFIGKLDFSSFVNELQEESAIRTIRKLSLVIEEGGCRFEFEGSGFLYKMVRNIMGTLLAVGHKKLSIVDIPPLFAEKNRSKAPATAPPQGLALMQVFY